MKCAQRRAGAHRPAASTPSRSPSSRPTPPRDRARPDPRGGRSRRSRYLPVLALPLGALCAFPDRPAGAQTPPEAQYVPRDWQYVPSGIGLGQRFRPVFFTSTGIASTSSAISTCNTGVQNAANNNASLRPFKGEFRALISTPTVDARDNTATTGTGVPIHWPGGAKVADNYAGPVGQAVRTARVAGAEWADAERAAAT